MPIRFARYSDLRVIAETLAAAFDGEELNSYFFPYRKEFYEDYVRAWYHVVLEKWWNYNGLWLVSFIEGSNGAETITGASQWERTGKGAEKVWGLNSWDPSKSACEPESEHNVTWQRLTNDHKTGRMILPVVQQYLDFERKLLTNRAIANPSSEDLTPMRKWDFGPTLFPFIAHLYNEPPYRRNHWQLDLLGVHPDHRKHGHGAELIAWGINRAKEDKLPAVVIMADGLEGYYHKHGFEKLVGYAYEKDLFVEEKSKDGTIVQKRLANPLRQRRIGGGGIAWTDFRD